MILDSLLIPLSLGKPCCDLTSSFSVLIHIEDGDLYGNRTRVTAVKVPCPNRWTKRSLSLRGLA